MLVQTFQHRSARVIGAARIVLAAFFLLATYLDPREPANWVELIYAGLTCYMLLAVAYTVAVWNDWWLEMRLSGPAHVLDIVAFTFLILETEGYASPFFTFFVFLILSAAIRWGWRETMLTAAVIMLLYTAAGLTADTWGTQSFELRRFVIRSCYIVVLSAILIWFGIHQQMLGIELTKGDHLRDGDRGNGPPVSEAIRYVQRRFGARRIVFAWWEADEPWIQVETLAPDERSDKLFRPPPGPLIPEEFGGDPFLFDCRGHRVLYTAHGRRHVATMAAPIEPTFASEFMIDRGIAIRVQGEQYCGEIFALGVPGLCSDDLNRARRIGEEISAAFRNAALLNAVEDAAATRARLALARDLHDTAVQSLAGAALRVKGARKSLAVGRDVDGDLAEIEQTLIQEQRDLRSTIAVMRGGRGLLRVSDLIETSELLAGRLARQWGISCTVKSNPPSIEVPAPFVREVHQLLKEAVANAVRHGRATNVSISVEEVNDTIGIEIADNGTGFPMAVDEDEVSVGGGAQPWSLNERVHHLNGTLMLLSNGNGSRLSISLPRPEPSHGGIPPINSTFAA